MADMGWTKHIADVEKAEMGKLDVWSIKWCEYAGATGEHEVVMCINRALQELPASLRSKIEKIEISREVNPNE